MSSDQAWREVGDRVFVRRFAFYDQNVGVVLGRTGAAVIDTRTTHRQADEVLDGLDRLTGGLPLTVINTHHHYDHTFGNARFLPAPIWGHERCAEVLRSDGDAMRAGVIEELPGLADELAAVQITPPDRTFADTAVVDLGDRLLDLRYLGRGHTDNDIVVMVPDAAVLFAGDLLENDAPPSYGDAYPAAWATTVSRRLLPLIAGPVVPGHGRVGDVLTSTAQAADLALMAELGARVAAGELSADEAIAAAPFPSATAAIALERSARELESTSAA